MAIWLNGLNGMTRQPFIVKPWQPSARPYELEIAFAFDPERHGNPRHGLGAMEYWASYQLRW